ncbi:hypothetical protein Hanom_Chr17g01585251 [Helianthus anomalus]
MFKIDEFCTLCFQIINVLSFKPNSINFFWSELQVLSFILVSNFRRCSSSLKLMRFVLNVFKSYLLCPLYLT